MSYELLHEETIGAGLRRVALERLREVISSLRDGGSPVHDRVHDARKRFKEGRSVVRLVRRPLGPLYALENGWFREAGRALSSFRDTEALLESARKWREELTAKAGSESSQRLLEALTEHQKHSSEGLDIEMLLASVVADCEDVTLRIESWPLSDISWDDVKPATQRAYRASRLAFSAASADPSAVNFHEWRKQAKDSWYQAQLLRNIWEEPMKIYRKILDDLSRTLGDHHDLTLLEEFVAVRLGDDSMLGALGTVRRSLEEDALSTGRRIYVERPRDFAARLSSYWTEWRNQPGPAAGS